MILSLCAEYVIHTLLHTSVRTSFRYGQVLDMRQLRMKLSLCEPVVMTTCWDHMISSMEKCIQDDDVVMEMLSAGNYDDALQSLSTSLEEGKVSPWLPVYISRYV